MARLGPFEPHPALAAAVSGGADSLALALLARDWVLARHGTLLALVVDHGLRPESAREAQDTVLRLGDRGIPARLLALHGLTRGPALAARARAARFAALAGACAEAGLLHLLLGHHAGDQAETLRMRQAAGSTPRGLAGMAALTETSATRLLRPLLAVPPGRLRALLRESGLDWVDDPSNRDPATLRARLRAELADPEGDGPQTRTLLAQAATHGAARAQADARIAATLAARVSLHPSGWAVLSAGPIAHDALAALLRTIAGRNHDPATAAVVALAAAPRAATLAGARLLPAGRAGGSSRAGGRAGGLGDLLVVRESAAMAPPVAATPGARWDNRFRLLAAPPGLTLGALGPDAPRLRRDARGWPAAVLATLPALRRGPDLVAVPHLTWPDAGATCAIHLAFAPPSPMACAPFRPATAPPAPCPGD
jgi:tRNA(Ile)-lysidine synthase